MQNKHFDSILEYCGSNGRWQWTRLILLEIISQTIIVLMLPQFGSLLAQYRCKIPELESRNWTFQQYLNVTTPTNDIGFDGCSHYISNYSALPENYEDAIRDIGNLGHSLSTCQNGFIYDLETASFKRSYTMEFDLICQRQYLRPLANAIFMMGLFSGLLVGGGLSDKFGRKWVSIILGVLAVSFGVTRSFVSTYPGFIITSFLCAFFEMSRYTVVWIWIAEVFGTKHRLEATCTVHIGFVIATICQIGTAYLVQNWRYLNLSFFVPSLLLPLSVYIMPESPRWLYARGRYSESLKIMRQIAKVNRKNTVTETTLENMMHDSQDQEVIADSNVSTTYGYLSLVKTPVMRKRSLIMIYVWFTTSMLYFGFTFASVKLPGNVYLNALVNNVAGIVPTIAAYYFMKYGGRRSPMIICLCGGALFSIITAFFLALDNKTIKLLSIVVATIGKCLLELAFTVVYLFTVELLPTVVRNMGTCACSSAARIGAAIAPFVNSLDTLWISAPNLVFAGLAGVAGVLCIFLPDTTDKSMPQTIEDVEKPSSDRESNRTV